MKKIKFFFKYMSWIGYLSLCLSFIILIGYIENVYKLNDVLTNLILTIIIMYIEQLRMKNEIKNK